MTKYIMLSDTFCKMLHDPPATPFSHFHHISLNMNTDLEYFHLFS